MFSRKIVINSAKIIIVITLHITQIQLLKYKLTLYNPKNKQLKNNFIKETK